MIMRRAAKRVVYAVIASSVVVFAVGAVHGAMVSQGLIARSNEDGCPLGYGRDQTPEQRVRSEARAHAKRRGEGSASARPALGFALDAATAVDIDAWARRLKLVCRSGHAGLTVACENIRGTSAEELEGIESLWFAFGGKGTLTSVKALRRSATADAVWQDYSKTVSELTRQAGKPVRASGLQSADDLSRNLLGQAAAEYRFEDYYAVVRATNMGGGFTLTEEYATLVD